MYHGVTWYHVIYFHPSHILLKAPTPTRRQRAFIRATAQSYYYMSYEHLIKLIKGMLYICYVCYSVLLCIMS